MADKPEKPKTSTYAFTSFSSYRVADGSDLITYTKRVREKILPEIKEQLQKKESGAQRVRKYKLF